MKTNHQLALEKFELELEMKKEIKTFGVMWSPRSVVQAIQSAAYRAAFDRCENVDIFVPWTGADIDCSTYMGESQIGRSVVVMNKVEGGYQITSWFTPSV